ncbi:MAG: DUF3177 family protein [Thermostichales cyanobacterium SZTDM-1c_bins_54]
MEFWFTPWVWWDFRVAVLLTVVVPLGLLLWAGLSRNQPVWELLRIYWQVSSLLAITVYLMIGGLPIGFLTGPAARALIPMALWFWPVLSLQIAEDPGWLSRVFLGWRWLLSVYMAVGFLFSLAFAPCAFQQPISPACQVWWQPPLGFKEIFHPGIPREGLGMVGVVGLLIYGLVAAWYGWQYRQAQGRQDL